jgi:hypothetical protein
MPRANSNNGLDFVRRPRQHNCARQSAESRQAVAFIRLKLIPLRNDPMLADRRF